MGCSGKWKSCNKARKQWETVKVLIQKKKKEILNKFKSQLLNLAMARICDLYKTTLYSFIEYLLNIYCMPAISDRVVRFMGSLAFRGAYSILGEPGYQTNKQKYIYDSEKGWTQD